VVVEAEVKEEPGRPLIGVNGVVCSKKDLTGPTLLEMYGYFDISGLWPTGGSLGLLWAMEEAHVYGLAENMPLDRFHYLCASLENVSPGLDIDLCV
jgi:hypothetical protein